MAGGMKIRGVTIEIGGDTTGLQKALKDVNKELNSTQKDLKDVNKLLNMDPGNAELLAQKQKDLAKAIDGTKEKLELLKSVSKESVSEKEWDAVQREIVETEQKLKGLENEYKNFGSIAAQQVAAAGEKVKDVGDKMQSVGKGMTTYVTAPIAAVGAASIAAFNDVDKGLDVITTKTGATGEALADMQDRMKNLATEIPTDFETAGNAIGEVNTRFGLTGDALETLSKQFIEFAQINNTDVSSSIDSVQSAMAAFGVDAKDAGLVLDVLNKAGQDTGVSMDTLSSELENNAVYLKEMGFNLSDSAMFLANLSKNGIESNTVMTGLKKAFASATKDGKSMDEALAELQQSMMDADTDTEAYALAMELFGNKAGGAIAEAVQTGRLNFEQFGTTLGDFAGSVEDTFNQTLDPIDEVKTLLNELKLVGADLVTAAGPLIKDVLGTLRDVVGDLKEKWEGLSPQMQETIVKGALLAAALGPVVTLIGGIVSGIGSIMMLVPTITGAISGLTGVLSTVTGAIGAAGAGLSAFLGPIALVAAAIAGLILIIKNWDTIIDGVKKTWEKAKESFNTFCDGMKSAGTDLEKNFSDVWDGIKADTTQAWNSIKTFVSQTTTAIKTSIVNGLNSAKMTADNILDSIKTKFTTVFDNIKKYVSKVIDWLKGIFNFRWELPHIKLPHFSISGKFSLDPPEVPHFHLEWYKKAMENGMILTNPTIFGAAGGRLLAGGEAGPEAVVGVSSLRDMIQNAVAAASGAGGDIIIPVYIGNDRIDEVIVSANNRINYRSGGR